VTQEQYYYAVGRRKTSVANVRLYMDKGPLIVNGKSMEDVFPFSTWQQTITDPLRLTNRLGQIRMIAKVTGGGVVSQAGALRHGISRALESSNPSLRPVLKKAGFLTRDSREKESKKYGLKRARKAKQWTKR
jgi:small subunit ribosomal protein S9